MQGPVLCRDGGLDAKSRRNPLMGFKAQGGEGWVTTLALHLTRGLSR